VKEGASPEGFTGNYWDRLEQQPKGIAGGQGVNVSPIPTKYKREETEVDKATGKEQKTQTWYADDYQDIAFPMIAVKPKVLEATQRALALKVFDQLGLVGPQRRGDPIMVGRIVNPVYRDKVVTFFVAWWLDPDTL
jgi:hypothetical protein